MLQEQIPTPSAPLPSSPANLGRPPAPTAAAPKATEETVIYIGTFRFSGGLDKLSPEELQTWVKPHTDKGMTFSALKKIVDNLSQFLRSKGYGFARAYLPAQEIKDGVVDITILLGRIEGGKKGDGIAIQGGEGLRLKEERVRQTLAAATVSQTPYLKVEGLERGLLLMVSCTSSAPIPAGGQGTPIVVRAAVASGLGGAHPDRHHHHCWGWRGQHPDR